MSEKSLDAKHALHVNAAMRRPTERSWCSVGAARRLAEELSSGWPHDMQETRLPLEKLHISEEDAVGTYVLHGFIVL